MITGLIPVCGGNMENVARTAESLRVFCDEIVIVSTVMFDDEKASLKKVADRVINLPWHFIAEQGFAQLHNYGAEQARNDWLIRLDVAETYLKSHRPIRETLKSSAPEQVFFCDHFNVHDRWRRVWNRRGAKWSGIIHESLQGEDSGLLFEMRDTPKTPGDPFRDEVVRWHKSVLYHILHVRLRNHPEHLGASDPGWLKFLDERRPDMNRFIAENNDLVCAMMQSDLENFKRLVQQRMGTGVMAYGVDFSPTGT